MNNLTLLHFQRYPRLVTLLFNIKHHMEVEKYDFPLVISGEVGVGKTIFCLHLIELWYRVVLERDDFDEEYIRHVSGSRLEWVKNLRVFQALDINANDEGADGFLSKESMSKFGRDIQKLYNVFRKKFFFTIIIIPDFFDLPLYFRKRIKGLFWINKRGRFKYYSKTGIKYLNAFNERKDLKTFDGIRPFFSGVFPDYKGILREPYDRISMKNFDVLSETLVKELEIDSVSKISTIESHKDDVLRYMKADTRPRDTCKHVGISLTTYYQIKRLLKAENKI